MTRRAWSPVVGSATAVALLAASMGGSVALAQSDETVKVIHVVVDSLHPDQVGPDTPNLDALRTQGVWYEQHRSVMSSETLPNHVAMATGTYPATNNLPGNDGRISVGDTVGDDLGPMSNRTATSFTVAVEQACPDLRTVTAFPKPYVFLTFEGEADVDYPQPTFHVPGVDTAPDLTVFSFVAEDLAQNGMADYSFVSFGDMDRAGHGDPLAFLGQTTLQRAFLQEADTHVGNVVQALQASGAWDTTVMIINSDHSMDWSAPAQGNIDIIGALEANPLTAGSFFGATNGATMFVYLNDPARPDADAMLIAARTTLLALDGLDEVLYREPNVLDPGNDLRSVHPGWRNWTPRVGEIFVTALPGFKAAALSEFPFPGSHGGVSTRHSTMMITGGWDGINAGTVISADPALVDLYDDTAALPGQSEQVDIAPTIGWLTGVPDPGSADGGQPQWEGRILQEAFSRQPAPSCSAAAVAQPDPIEPAPSPDPEPLPATGGGAALVGLAMLEFGRRLRGLRQTRKVA